MQERFQTTTKKDGLGFYYILDNWNEGKRVGMNGKPLRAVSVFGIAKKLVWLQDLIEASEEE